MQANAVSSSVIVRTAQPSDVEAICALTAAARKVAYQGIIPVSRQADFAKTLATTSQNVAAWHKKIERALEDPAKRTALVAVVDERVAGFYYARLIKGDLSIRNLYVDPTTQGKGLGSRLLVSGLKALPHQAAWLHVLAENKPSIGFYERHGFTTSQEPCTTFYGAARVLMKRTS
jgi:ribosomal protein S18 acetylase RimI-like enzyme